MLNHTNFEIGNNAINDPAFGQAGGTANPRNSAVRTEVDLLEERRLFSKERTPRLWLIAMVLQLRQKHFIGIGIGELVLHSRFQSPRLFFSPHFSVQASQLRVQLQVILLAGRRLRHRLQDLYGATRLSAPIQSSRERDAAM